MKQNRTSCSLLPSGGISHTYPWSPIPWQSWHGGSSAPCPHYHFQTNTAGTYWDTNRRVSPKRQQFPARKSISITKYFNGKRLPFPVIWLLWEAAQGGETIDLPISFKPPSASYSSRFCRTPGGTCGLGDMGMSKTLLASKKEVDQLLKLL